MRTLAIVLVALVFQVGCADFIIREDDSGATIAGKTVSRVLLCAVSICASELEISLINEREGRQAAAQQRIDYWNRAIGLLTFEEAVMRLGPPTSLVETGRYLVAAWDGAPDSALLLPMPSLGFGPSYLAGQVPGHRLELTFSPSAFDPEQKILRHWRMW